MEAVGHQKKLVSSLSLQSLKDAAQARLILHLSKSCHIVGNHMSLLKFSFSTLFLLCTKPLSVASAAVQSRATVLLFVTASIVCRFCVLLCVVVFTVLFSGAIVTTVLPRMREPVDLYQLCSCCHVLSFFLSSYLYIRHTPSN